MSNTLGSTESRLVACLTRRTTFAQVAESRFARHSPNPAAQSCILGAMTPPQESENFNSDEASSNCCGGVIRSEAKTQFKPLYPTEHAPRGILTSWVCLGSDQTNWYWRLGRIHPLQDS